MLQMQMAPFGTYWQGYKCRWHRLVRIGKWPERPTDLVGF